jgi:uncharacterized membrane protein
MGRSKSETLRRNERIKHGVTALTAFSVALIVGSVLRLLNEGQVEAFQLFWASVGLCLIWIASLLLTLLEAEDEI